MERQEKKPVAACRQIDKPLGVDWQEAEGLWQAAVCVDGKRYDLGSYHRLEEAVEARSQVEASLRDARLSGLVIAALNERFSG